MITILEEKTAVYTEHCDNRQISILICALKVELSKLIDRLAPAKTVAIENRENAQEKEEIHDDYPDQKDAQQTESD